MGEVLGALGAGCPKTQKLKAHPDAIAAKELKVSLPVHNGAQIVDPS